jgi:hypothetical protein
MRCVLSACAALLATLAFVTAADAATTATLSPNQGAPTTSVTVSGSGFDASAAVDVFFDTTDLALATSNASGAVSFTISVPANAQPGTHWITLDERRTNAAAQASFSVYTDWAQGGFGPSWRGYNPFENTINTGNVNQLSEVWGQRLDGLGNAKSLIVYSNTVYVEDSNRTIRAFTQAGTLLWTATAPGTGLLVSTNPMVAGLSKVFVGDSQGNVTAYASRCRTDGGPCTPAWTRNIGTGVSAAMSLHGGVLYAPGADGKVHVLGPGGAVGTSVTGGSSSGGVSAPVSFSPNGNPWIVQGAYAFNGQSGFFPNSALSGVAVDTDSLGFATEAGGHLDSLGGNGWSDTLGGTGCTPPMPVYANSVVYAAGCTSLGAYDAGTGAALWTITTSGPAAGLAVANGVLYACVGGTLSAYAGSYGGRLWSGDYCAARPVINNGMLFTTGAGLEAYTLTGALSTAMGHRRFRRPNPRQLRPTIRVHRNTGHHLKERSRPRQ